MYPGDEAAAENILDGMDYLFNTEGEKEGRGYGSAKDFSDREDAYRFAATPDRSFPLRPCATFASASREMSREFTATGDHLDTASVFFSTRGTHVRTDTPVPCVPCVPAYP